MGPRATAIAAAQAQIAAIQATYTTALLAALVTYQGALNTYYAAVSVIDPAITNIKCTSTGELQITQGSTVGVTPLAAAS